MAIGFGATFGASTSDAIASGFVGQSAQRTIAVTCFRQSNGPNNLGRVFDFQAVGGAVEYMSGQASGSNLIYNRRWSSSGDSQWFIDGTNTLNVVHSIVISYDTSSTSNVPTGYRNGASTTITRNVGTAAPSGTVLTTTSEMIIGNRSDALRCFDGWISNLAIWNEIIPADIAQAISAGISPLAWRSNLVYYNPLIRSSQDLTQSRTQTVTGTAVQPHPRIIGGL